MQFDDRRAGRARAFDLPRIRIDEQRNANAGIRQFGDGLAQSRRIARHIEAAFSGDLRTLFGHQAAVRGTQLCGDADHLARHRHFQVQPGLHQLLQRERILIDDVPAILTQMHGDAVGAGLLGQECGMHRVRMSRTSCLPHCGDMIDVDSQRDARLHVSLQRPTLLRPRNDFATSRVLRLRPSRQRSMAARSCGRSSSACAGSVKCCSVRPGRP